MFPKHCNTYSKQQSSLLPIMVGMITMEHIFKNILKLKIMQNIKSLSNKEMHLHSKENHICV